MVTPILDSLNNPFLDMNARLPSTRRQRITQIDGEEVATRDVLRAVQSAIKKYKNYLEKTETIPNDVTLEYCIQSYVYYVEAYAVLRYN